MRTRDKPLIWLHGEIRSPPMSSSARTEAGYLLRRLQRGETLSLPESRPMPAIGSRCHELRIDVDGVAWRVFYRTDPDAILVLEVLKKKTQATPRSILDACRRRV